VYQRILVGTDGSTTVATAVDRASGLVDAVTGFDLPVVGNKGMTGANRFFVGSVPNKVSHHVPCSMLIARTT
jgi:nucleotide-binding universal stress UspA family protein